MWIETQTKWNSIAGNKSGTRFKLKLVPVSGCSILTSIMSMLCQVLLNILRKGLHIDFVKLSGVIFTIDYFVTELVGYVSRFRQRMNKDVAIVHLVNAE